jgi:histidinol-phosphatase
VQSRGRRRRVGYIPRIVVDRNSSPGPDADPHADGGLAADLALALELADVADAITLRRFRAADLVVETKPDLTPVTEADRAVEAQLRAHLARERPGDAVLGEEAGETAADDRDATRRWLIDPIDGTKGYARGLPVWATLVALEVDGNPVVGVVSAPALGARWWAALGLGAFRNGDPIVVSRVGRVEDAHLAYDSVRAFEEEGIGDQFLALARRCWRTRGFGDFWSHVLVADGSIDIAIEVSGRGAPLQVWDLAAPMVVVQEAGGRFTDLGGVACADAGNVVATNGLLHEEVLAALRSGNPG